MFVYKKNSLQRRIDADGTDRGVYTLTHTPTNVSISYEFQLNYFNPDVNLTMKEGRVAMTKPFIIYKKRADNSFEFYQESFDGNKTLLDNWKEAIGLFEGKIFEYLNEQAPQPEPPKTDTPKDPPQKFSELPEVGDIIKTGNRFGRVIDVNENTRDIKVEELTENEAREIIRIQRQAMTQESNITGKNLFGFTGDPADKAVLEGIEEFRKKAAENAAKLETGAMLDDGFFRIRVDEESSNVFIIRPTPPAPPSDGPPPSGDDEQKQPDNIIDLDPPKDDTNGSGDDQGADDQTGDGDDQQGDDQQGDDQEVNGGNPDDFGDDDEGDQNFGGAGDDDSEFEKAIKDANEIGKAKEEERKRLIKQAKEDAKQVEQFLGKNASELKTTFTLRQAKNLIGSELFPELSVDENITRVNEALKLIFD